MSASEYMACTWREFCLRYQGYQLKRSHDFEGSRLIAYKLLWAHMDHTKAMLPPMNEWWPLLSDEKEVKASQDEIDAEYLRLKKIMDLAEKNKLNN